MSETTDVSRPADAADEKQSTTAGQAIVTDSQQPSDPPTLNTAAPAQTATKSRSKATPRRRGNSTNRQAKAKKKADAVAEQGLDAKTGPTRTRWRRFMALGESWGGSAIFHGVLLLLLSLATLAAPRPDEPPQIVSVIERAPEELNERLDESLTPATMVSTSPAIGVSQTHGDPLSSAQEPQLSQQAVESVDGPQVSLADIAVRALPGSQLTDDLGMDAPGDPAAAVEGYGAALDRITQELLMMLTKSKVLVVWLLDESESMEDDRKEIEQRIDRVYKELGLRNTDEESDALLTAITSYGADFTVHTSRPTSDAKEIRQAVAQVPNDESGVENLCQSVIAATREYKRFATRGRRQLALIVVTDESGDDGEIIEQAIASARDAQARIYTLGREAVFGYPYAHIRWTWVDPEKPKDKVTADDKIVFWLRIRRGPETPRVEQLQTNGLWRRFDAHPSGFGPYELVRMSRETGGIYFMLPSLESNLVRGEKRIYELDRMRPYLPDLSSRQDYIEETAQHPLRQALWEIIGTLNPYAVGEINLREYFSINPAEFRSQAEQEHSRAQALLKIFEAAEERLLPLEREREQETSPRWQASYDLLLAQVVSYQVRLYEYGAYLEAFVRQPKQAKSTKTNRWRIHTVDRTIMHEQNAELIERSKQLLQSVIAFHPGTPYAARARWELNRGFGIDVAEHYHDPRRDSIERPKY